MPPPNAAAPLGERLKQLAQTLQFGWFFGHFLVLIAVFRYFLSYITLNTTSLVAQVSYRVAFASAAVTYGIVVYKQYASRGLPDRNAIPAFAMRLIGDENVQYLVMSIVWLSSRQIALALLPFTIYSFFHVATYARSYLIPTFQPPQPVPPTSQGGRATLRPPPLAESVGRFIKLYYDASMMMVAQLELFLFFRLLGSALTFSSGSWILLVVYFTFFRSRYSQSSFVQATVARTTARIDVLVSHQSTPDPIRQAWEVFKNLVRQVYDTTDYKRYLGKYRPEARGKKPQ